MKSIESAVAELQAQGSIITAAWDAAASAPDIYLLKNGTAWSPVHILDHLTVTQSEYVKVLRALPAPTARSQQHLARPCSED